MELIIPNIDKIVEQNRLPEITNPVYLDGSSTPTKDGIFSYEIFGRPGGNRRKFQFGYIDLGKRFIHPVAYIQMLRLFSKLPDILTGNKTFKVTSEGHLIEDPDGETGIDFLYKNFDRIKFDDRGVKSRKTKNEIFEAYTKDEVFCSKWLVIPPFYFDINLRTDEGARSIDELGSLYIKLISMTRLLKNEGSFFTSYSMENTIQTTLYDIYKIFATKVSMKQGLIHKDILGKNVDYTVRGVVSAPSLRKANSYRDQEVPYGYVGVPLYMLCTTFFPFVVAELERLMQELNAYKVYLSNSAGHEILASTIDTISSTNYEKMIKLYAKSPENRTQEFKIETSDGANALENLAKKLGRKVTVTDILYIAVSEVIKDKFVIFVRYPLEDYRNVGTFRPVILTTEDTVEMHISELWKFKRYPDLSKPNLSWIDSIRPNFSVLSAYDADFDGDTMSIKGIYSQEANMELAENSMKPLNLLDPNGGESRGLIQDSYLSFYSMTK